MKAFPNRHPFPFLILAILGLLAALWAGLMRLGWQLPALTPSLAMLHGPVMISGFLGTLITLERAVAMKQKWMYLPPLLSGLGWLVAIIFPNLPFGVILLTLASLGGVAILAEIVRREFALHTCNHVLRRNCVAHRESLMDIRLANLSSRLFLDGIPRADHCGRKT